MARWFEYHLYCCHTLPPLSSMTIPPILMCRGGIPEWLKAMFVAVMIELNN